MPDTSNVQVPTHRCTCCHGLWRLHLRPGTSEPDHWQALTVVGACCDNVPFQNFLRPVTASVAWQYLESRARRSTVRPVLTGLLSGAALFLGWFLDYRGFWHGAAAMLVLWWLMSVRPRGCRL